MHRNSLKLLHSPTELWLGKRLYVVQYCKGLNIVWPMVSLLDMFFPISSSIIVPYNEFGPIEKGNPLFAVPSKKVNHSVVPSLVQGS